MKTVWERTKITNPPDSNNYIKIKENGLVIDY